MKILTLTFFLILFSGCTTKSITVYPKKWPALIRTSNISGIYKNGLAASSHQKMNGTLFAYFAWIHSSLYDKKKSPINKLMQKEFNKRDNDVSIIQDKKKISVALYNKKNLVKQFNLHNFQNDPNGAIIHISGPEWISSYGLLFFKANDGSLILREYVTETYGWFLESTDVLNYWFRWEKK